MAMLANARLRVVINRTMATMTRSEVGLVIKYYSMITFTLQTFSDETYKIIHEIYL